MGYSERRYLPDCEGGRPYQMQSIDSLQGTREHSRSQPKQHQKNESSGCGSDVLRRTLLGTDVPENVLDE